MIRARYRDAASIIASANTAAERQAAGKMLATYYATTTLEPTRERMRILRVALTAKVDNQFARPDT